MATPNMFNLLNDDAQDQEIQIPAAKKVAPAPKPRAQPTGGASVSKPADNRGPRKEGARPPRRDNEDRGGRKQKSMSATKFATWCVNMLLSNPHAIEPSHDWECSNRYFCIRVRCNQKEVAGQQISKKKRTDS